MHKDNDEDEHAYSAGQGAQEGPGKSIEPDSMPDDEAPRDPDTCIEAPIGKPVSEEQYRKMKEAANKKEPPHTTGAQADPSA